MLSVTCTELRNHAKKYFDAVEKGEEIEVYRHGKPIAIVFPYRKQGQERWKQARPLKLKPGVSLSAAILSERAESQ